MENFFFNGRFISDMDDLLLCLDLDEETIPYLPEDYSIECFDTELEPIQTLSAEFIAENISEERFSENNYDGEYSNVVKLLNENIDFDKINSLLPKLYYETNRKFTITKADLLTYIK